MLAFSFKIESRNNSRHDRSGMFFTPSTYASSTASGRCRQGHGHRRTSVKLDTFEMTAVLATTGAVEQTTCAVFSRPRPHSRRHHRRSARFAAPRARAWDPGVYVPARGRRPARSAARRRLVFARTVCVPRPWQEALWALWKLRHSCWRRASRMPRSARARFWRCWRRARCLSSAATPWRCVWRSKCMTALRFFAYLQAPARDQRNVVVDAVCGLVS